MNKKIALIPGDGIGPDVVSEAVKILNKVAEIYGHQFSYENVIAGGSAIDKFGHPLPDEQLKICLNSDAVLLGAVGGPKWDNVEPALRPEKGLLGLRGGMKVFANLRPAVIFPQLKAACPLKDEIIEDGLDILIVRELTGGIYFGDRGFSEDGQTAWDTEKYSTYEIERILKIAFESAKNRRKKVTVVDKANILNSSRLWRSVAEKMHKDYSDIELNFLYIDNAAMQIVRNPSQFDVIATSNMFGDILSDEASQITGSIGMLASASLGDGTGPGLYEPIHGSAPDIAGKNIANPTACILAGAKMLNYIGYIKEGARIEKTIEELIKEGKYLTKDLGGDLGTKEFTKKVIERL